jgi:hypothetical protein
VETPSLEQRVAILENQMASVLKNGIAPTRDWRDVVREFEGDEMLLAVFREAMKLREADRRKARRRFRKHRARVR